MYKAQLQELCQRKSWGLPEYASIKLGASHNPSFKSTVTVNGVSFESPVLCKNLKQSQAEAAKLACLHFTSSPSSSASVSASSSISASSSVPVPASTPCSASAPFSAPASTPFSAPASTPFSAPASTPSAHASTSAPTYVSLSSSPAEMIHMYKHQLQTYALKNSLGLPEYACRREGPPHATRFSCKVSIARDTYECQEFFTTLKEAENAVAKVALKALATTFVPQDSFLIYKNLLQELSQKQGFSLPIYATMSCGLPHMPTFISTVEVKGETYQGESAKTKKLAEMNAAKVAYITIKECTCQPVETTSSSSKSTSTILNMKVEESYEEKFVTSLVAPVSSKNGGSDTSRKRDASYDPHLSQQNSGPTLPFSEDGDFGHNSSLKINLKLEKPTGTTNMVPQKKVCIQSRKPNMKLPPGTVVCSDDRWIATETTPDETSI